MVFAVPQGLLGQPANDNCDDAIEILNLNGSCGTYNTEGATLDFGVGNCGAWDPNGNVNVWFEFQAQGPDLEVEVSVQPGAPYQVVVLTGNCSGSFLEIECADSEALSSSDLEEDENYFIMVVFEEDRVDEVTICVNNPVATDPPPNDDPCDAISLNPNGGCHGGTNIAANPDVVNPNCQNTGESTVWYSVELTPGNNQLEVILNNFSMGPEVSVLVGQFLNGCGGSLTIVPNGSYCGSPNTNFIVSGMQAGVTYFIGIGSAELDEGNYQICVQQDGPPPGCSENDLCSNSENFPVIPSSTETQTVPPVCISGCNIGSTPNSTPANCIPPTWGGVFFSFTTDNIAQRAGITVDSDDMLNFGAALFSGGCGNLSPLGCVTTNNGSISFANQPVLPNTTYYIFVASSTSNMGEFDVCVQTFELPEQCIPPNTPATLEVTNTSLGSPFNGPFLPGEEVTFEYTLPSYQATTSVQWLQSIIPVFGSGWDPSSFSGIGEPVNSTPPNSAGPGSWAWYPENQMTYNGNSAFYSLYINEVGRLALCYWTDPNCINTGINAGDGLPAGWYAYSPGGGPNCINNGNPNNGYGDGNIGPWTVTFTLTARDFFGAEGCEQTQFIDLSVQVYTMSDQQVGCWTGGTPNSCAGDDFASSGELVNQCCESPQIDPVSEEICSGDQTNIILTSNQDPFVEYSWTVSAPPSVTGASDGNGNLITQTLTNSSSSIQIVNYSVTGINDAEGCQSAIVDILVSVLPELNVNLGPDISGCAQGQFTLNANVSGGSGGGYTYNWSNNLPGIPNPTVSPNTSTTYSLTVTDGNGCTGTDEVLVEVSPAILIDIEGDREFCEENLFTQLMANPTTGSPAFSYNWSLPSGQQTTGQSINAMESGTYQVEVLDANGCTGFRTVEITMHPTPIIYIDVWPDVTEICPQESVEILASSFANEPIEYNWVTPLGDENGQVVLTTFPGMYVINVEDATGCVNSDSILIEENDPPSPKIIGDSSICSGDSVVWSLSEDFNNIEWSTGSTVPEITVFEGGMYYVTVTEGVSCEGVDSLYLDEITQLPISFSGPTSLCPSSSDTLWVLEEYADYLWDDSTDRSFRLIEGPGNYSVTVTNDQGCIEQADFSVEEDEDLQFDLSVGDTTICPGDSIRIIAQKGFSAYLWSDSSSNSELMVSNPGAYTLTVSNNFGCSGEQSVTVEHHVLPDVNILGEDQFCFDDSTELSVNVPAMNYLWSDSSSTEVLMVNQSGDYAVTITDTNGCVQSDTLMVNELEKLEVQILGQFEFCPGDSVSLYTPPDYEQYLWSNEAENSTILISDPGVYSVEVLDTNGCVAVDSVEVSQLDSPSPQIIGSSSFCTGNSTTLNGGDYESYLWSTGDTSQLIEVSVAGLYQLTVTDVNECSGVTDIEVTEEESLSPEILPQSPGFCPGNAAELSAQEGFESYLWNTGEDNISILVDSAGLYTLTVFDSDGCSGTASVNVTAHDSVTVEISGEDFICPGGESILNAGSGFESYEWIGTDSTGQFLSAGEAGIYGVVVYDANGCSGSANLEIQELEVNVPEIDGKLAICLEESTAISIVEDYEEFLWSDGSTTNQITVDQPGFYGVTVTDGNGCIADIQFEIEGYPEPMVEIAGSLTFCEGFSTLLDAGQGFESYIWSDSDQTTSSQLEVTAPGNYSVTVTDGNGCSAENQVFVEELTELNPPVFGPDRFCSGNSIELSTDIYEVYNWSTGANTQAIDVFEAGTYSVTVEDSDGCTGESSFEVNEIVPPFAELVNEMEVCNLSADTSILNFNEFITGGDQSGNWEDLDDSGFSGSFPILDFDGVEPGTYNFRYTTESADPPCEEVSYIVRVLVRNCDCPNPSFANPGPLCNSNVSIKMNDFLTGEVDGVWSVVESPAGNNSADFVEDEFMFEGADPGDYLIRFSFEGTLPDGCPLYDEKIVTISSIAFAGEVENPLEVCRGEDQVVDLFLQANGADSSGIWTEVGDTQSQFGGFNPQEGTFNVERQLPGNYQFSYLVSSNEPCPADESIIEVVVNPLPIVDAGSDKTITCENTTVEIGGQNSTDDPNLIYRWYRNGVLVQELPEINYFAEEGGNYVLEALNVQTACLNIDSVQVFEENEPITDLVIETIAPLCPGSSSGCIVVEGVEGGSGPFQFALDESSFTTNFEYCDLAAGTYRIEVIDVNGCTFSKDVVVPEPNALFVDLGADLFVQYRDQVELVFESNISIDEMTSLNWFINGENANCPSCNSLSLIPENSILVSIVIETENGCEVFDEIFINVNRVRNIYAPNVIRPSSDLGSINSGFTFFGDLETVLMINRLEVFDRWGEKVFEVHEIPPNQPELGWNGAFNSEDAPPGVYLFYGEVLLDNGETESLTGEFILIE